MKPLLSAVKEKIVEYFSLDYRSLALMRFGAGLVIILDLIARSHSLVAHYTDLGVLPRADLLSIGTNRFFVSLHMMSGLPWVEAVLFIIAGVFALMLMVGYRTALATIMSWFLLISLQNRNGMIIQGGDIVFRVVLFWMIFLPTGKRWSLDRLLGRTAKTAQKTILSGATLAYITQIVILYVMSGVLKTGAAWQDGTAVYYALSVDQLIRPLGEHLRTMTALTHFFTYATIKMEIYGPILFFSPWKTGLFRTIGVLGFALMQIGFNISMHLGLFGVIMIMVTFGLLPSYFWDVVWVRVANFFKTRAQSGLRIYYDVGCGFCFKMVHILRNFLLLSPSTRIAPSSDNADVTTLMERENSWVVIDRNGKVTLGFDGVATVVGYSPLFFWLKYILVLPGIRDIGELIYQKVAESRLQVCLPDPTEVRPTNRIARAARTTTTAILIFLTAFIVVWNIDPDDTHHLLHNESWLAWSTRLDQQFGMFAPTPLIEDGWYVIPGVLQSGREIDLFKDGPRLEGKKFFAVSYEKPRHVANGYPDQRWQKYLMNVAESDNSKYRLPLGKYICRTWNNTHTGEDTLQTFDIEYMIETTPAPGETQEPAHKVTLWSHHCFDTPLPLPPPPEE